MHSPEQIRKKDEARKESVDHFKNASVMHERGGKDHEAHKQEDMRDGMSESMNEKGVS